MKFYLLQFFLSIFSVLNAQTPLLEGNLHVKGVLKNNTPVVYQPFGDSIAQLKAFDVVYLFHNSSENFHYIGFDSQEPIGYIPKKSVLIWNNRLCLGFTPISERNPTLIFKDSESLKACLLGAEDFYSSDGTPHDNTIAQEPEDGLADKQFTMPVLDKKRVGITSIIYKVGFLAGGKTKLTSSTNDSKKPSSKLAELELMFLLDATRDNAPFIHATEKIIENIEKSLSTNDKIGLRLGVTTFRDYISYQKLMEYIVKQHIPLTNNIAKVKKAISSEIHEAVSDSEDMAEAVFDGYFSAITETNWRDAPNTLRVIVLIGDASGHKPGSPKNPMNYSEDLLLNKASENRVRTIAVKILSGRTEDDDLSRSQFNSLAQGLTTADKGQYIEVGYANDVNIIEEFIDKTSARIEAEINRLEKLIDVVEESRSDVPVFSGDNNSTDNDIILKNIKIESVDTGKPIEFSTGWIGESNSGGRKNVTSFVYITKNEFERMLTYIRLVYQVIINPELALDGTIKEVVEISTGEKLEGNDIEKHYTKNIGLPINSDILKIPVSDLNPWSKERKKNIIQKKLLTLENWIQNLDNWFNAPGTSKMKYTLIPIKLLP